MTISSWMSSVMNQIGPQRPESSALELEKKKKKKTALFDCLHSVTQASVNINKSTPKDLR